MVVDILFVILGLVVLLTAGDILVRGAVGLATALKVPTLLVSLTIVAFGTSAPELVVSVQSVLSGSPGIALGNIIGSNIANVLLVIGLPALIYPITTNVKGLRRHAMIMLVATAALVWIAYGPGVLDRTSGAALFACIILYVGYTGWKATRGGDDPVLDDVAEYAENGLSAKTLMFLAIGLVGLPLGAHLLVENGADLAADLGVREAVIGLTIVAFGTSLPELATVVAAAMHKKSDVAIGNVIGSNIFNIFAVGGAAGLAGTAAFDPTALRLDIPVMVIAAVALSAYVFTRRGIGRLAGLIMITGYVGFIAILALQAGGA